MKTSELKKWLKARSFTFREEQFQMENSLIIQSAGWRVARVALDQVGLLNTDFAIFAALSPDMKRSLAEKLFEFSLTPPDERKDEVRFRVLAFPETEYPYIVINMPGGEGESMLTSDVKEPEAWETSIFTPTTWDAVRGNLPAYDKDNPIFEEVTNDD